MRKLLKMPLFALAMLLLAGLAAAQAILPPRARSDRENRALAGIAAPTVASVTSGAWMRSAESYVDDQFPGRDAWMDLQALWDAALLRNARNGILTGRGGWLFEEAHGISTRIAAQSIQALSRLAEHAKIPTAVMLVPMSSAIYPQQLPAGYAADDQAAVLASLYAQAEGIETLDVLAPLRENTGEHPLFYRTDHHWTAEGARYGYDMLREAWVLPDIQEQITEAAAEGFFGTYYARAPSPLIRGDTLRFEMPQGIALLVEGEEKPGLYDPEQMRARDKYASLLWGNHGRITLTGGDPEGGTLLVIKDSYANALLPLLAQHYARIDAVDLRYFGGDLAALLEETEAERILCLYGLTTFLQDRNLLLHTADLPG